MNTEPNTITRREALLGALKGTVAASLALSVVTEAAPVPALAPAPEFVPENDYPYFGPEPGGGR